MATVRQIIPHLWFEKNPEEAVEFYTTQVFKDSKIIRKSYYTKEGFEEHKHPAGEVLTLEFDLEGNRFVALNGGPGFTFNESVSFMITCKNQEEIDHYYDTLSKGGEQQQCGWCKDKFGVVWQVIPEKMMDWTTDKDTKKVERMLHEMFKMKKLDMEVLEKAFKGELVEA